MNQTDRKGNSNKSEIMDMENVNDADNVSSAPDTTEIADNAANSEIVHSADRHLSTSNVRENSVPEKSVKSLIMDNGAPDESDIVRTVLPWIQSHIVVLAKSPVM